MSEAQGLHSFLRSRRSIRSFVPEAIPPSTVERIIATAAYAPSGHHSQPWRFVIVTTTEIKSRLADALLAAFRADMDADRVPAADMAARIEKSRSRLLGAPVVIVLCLERTEESAYRDERRRRAEHRMYVQSAAAAGLQLLLAAHAEGLAGVWICSPLFAPQAVTTSLSLPGTWEPQAMYYLGRSDRDPPEKKLKPLEMITRWI